MALPKLALGGWQWSNMAAAAVRLGGWQWDVLEEKCFQEAVPMMMDGVPADSEAAMSLAKLLGGWQWNGQDDPVASLASLLRGGWQWGSQLSADAGDDWAISIGQNLLGCWQWGLHLDPNPQRHKVPGSHAPGYPQGDQSMPQQHDHAPPSTGG